MKKKSFFTVCFVLLSVLGFLHIGGGKCLALPIVDPTPLKVFVIDGKLNGFDTDTTVTLSVSRTNAYGDLVYSTNNMDWNLAPATLPSLEGGTPVYWGLSTSSDINPEIIGAPVEFIPSAISPSFSQKPILSVEYYPAMIIDWLPGLSPGPGPRDLISTTGSVVDGLSTVPIPGSAIVLVSLLGGFFALGKRKKRETV